VALKADAEFVSAAWLKTMAARVTQCMEEFFSEHPALGAIERPELKRRLALASDFEVPPYFDDLLALLQARGVVAVESNSVSLPRRERKLEGALAEQAAKLEQALREGALAPPSPAEVGAALKIPPKTLREILKFLGETGKVEEAAPEIVFHTVIFSRARAAVVDLLERQRQSSMSEIRQMLGMNRKYVVPLMELLDRKGVTVRVGDKRELKK
jgi:selenocysteine-specific elongation factor